MNVEYLIGAATPTTPNGRTPVWSSVRSPTPPSALWSAIYSAPLANTPAGQAFEIRLDPSCCTNLTIEGALGLDSARREVQNRGGTLSLLEYRP